MPCGKINGMELRIDQSGRIVLPKPLRERLGVKAGATFEATEVAGGLLLRPVTQRRALVEEDGFLVHTGEATRPFSWEDLSEDLEKERLRTFLGQ
jgi:AbrB family looped-hinge helix DNA binding protein